jgi:hypothetical protein
MPDRAPTRIAPTPTTSPAPLPIPQNSPLQEEVESANAATPSPKSTTEAVAKTVSATGAATDVVHSGGGWTSGSGPFVKTREHPGLATRASVANEMRSTEFTVLLPKGRRRPAPFRRAGEAVSLNSFVRPNRGGDEAVPQIVRIYRVKIDTRKLTTIVDAEDTAPDSDTG